MTELPPPIRLALHEVVTDLLGRYELPRMVTADTLRAVLTPAMLRVYQAGIEASSARVLYSTAQVAAMFNISRQRVRQLAARLNLGAPHATGRVFTEADIETLRRRRELYRDAVATSRVSRAIEEALS